MIKTEKLEKAYVNSAVPSAEYESACGELITKYKTLRNTLSDTVPDVSPSWPPTPCTARRRVTGRWACPPIEHRVNNPSDRSSSSAVSVAECVHHYIGAMDTIKLNMVAKDQVAPCLSDLLVSLYKVPQLPADFKGKAVAQQWLERLEKMRASDELGDDEVRQLLFDVENSYNAFMQLLGGERRGVDAFFFAHDHKKSQFFTKSRASRTSISPSLSADAARKSAFTSPKPRHHGLERLVVEPREALERVLDGGVAPERRHLRLDGVEVVLDPRF